MSAVILTARRSAQNASRCAGALSDTLQVCRSECRHPSLCEIEDEEGPLNGVRDDGYNADSGRSRGGSCRGAIRPIEASTDAISNGSNTSTPAVGSAQIAAIRRRRAERSIDLERTVCWEGKLPVASSILSRVP